MSDWVTLTIDVPRDNRYAEVGRILDGPGNGFSRHGAQFGDPKREDDLWIGPPLHARSLSQLLERKLFQRIRDRQHTSC